MTLGVFGPELVLYDDGTIARNAAVTVVLRGTNTNAALFSDVDGDVPLANPVSTDANGNLFFYTTPGEYEIVSGGARVPILALSSGTGVTGVGVVPYSQKGPLSVTIGTVPFVAPFDLALQGVTAAVLTAPTGADIILDLKVNGVSAFTAGARPRILAGTTDSTEVIPDVITTLDAGDHMTMDIVQVGSTTPGTSLGASVRYLPL